MSSLLRQRPGSLSALAALLIGLCALGLPVGAASAAPASSPVSAAPMASLTSEPRVLFIGMTGVSWNDISPQQTPHLWALAARGSIGSLVTKNVGLRTCRADGWMSLGAGGPVQGPRTPGASPLTIQSCPPMPAIEGARVADWAAWEAAASAQSRDTQPGTLADVSAAAGQCISARGPGAQLAAANTRGRVRTEASCPITLVDAGAVTATSRAHQLGSLIDGKARSDDISESRRASQLAAVDRTVDATLAQTNPRTRIVLASLAADSGRPTFGVLVEAGPGIPAGTIASDSTRQSGLAQSVDLTASILAGAGLPVPASVIGSPLRTLATTQSVAERVDERVLLQRQVGSVDSVQAPAMLFNALVLIALALKTWWLRRTGNRFLQRILPTLTLWAVAIPVASLLVSLVPWSGIACESAITGEFKLLTLVSYLGLVALIAAAVAGAARALVLLGERWLDGDGAALRPWRTVGAIGLITLAVVGLDALTGSRLALTSTLGLHPLDGGRFFGIGNVPFALLGTGALLAAGALAGTLRGGRANRVAAAWAAAIIALALIIDAAPMWGADAGGPLALLPAGAVLVLLVAGMRISWIKIVGLGLAAAALVAAAATLDWLRPASERTHLGRFVEQLVHGQGGEVLARRLSSNWAMLNGSFALTWLVPLVLLGFAYLVWRPRTLGFASIAEATPWLRATLGAIVLLNVIGFLSNDSGTGIPPASGLMFGPALLAVIATSPRAQRQQVPTPPAAPAPSEPRA